MTLLPSSDFGVRGVLGPAYEVGERCSVPDCGHRSAHGHHLWPRSFLRGQPYEYVQLPEGTVIANKTGLCSQHHDEVTGEVGGHRARIVFTSGLFFWEHRRNRLSDIWDRVGPIYPQPSGVSTKVDTPVDTEEVCPTCGHHTKPRKPGPKRESKTWTVDVPTDGELGADVLDEFVLWVAEALGFDDERSRLRRYHALVNLLIWAIQRREEFLADLKEAAEA